MATKQLDLVPHAEPEPAESPLAPFLSRLAHDIRGPAGVTWGALDELESRLGPGSPEASLLALARRGLRRVLRISERLAMAAQLENGALELERRIVDVARLVEESAGDAAALEGRKGIAVETVVVEGRFVDADPQWLGPAITEVVANAIRHARRNVRVACASEAGRIEIAVEDDGGGFSAAARASAFRRYDSPEGRSGLGLSLAIAHDVLRAHGGEIVIEEPAEGSRVALRIPLATDSMTTTEGRIARGGDAGPRSNER